jgi:hypothetical protein
VPEHSLEDILRDVIADRAQLQRLETVAELAA